MTRELPDWSMLQAAISGEVILPKSPAYETPKGATPYRFVIPTARSGLEGRGRIENRR